MGYELKLMVIMGETKRWTIRMSSVQKQVQRKCFNSAQSLIKLCKFNRCILYDKNYIL